MTSIASAGNKITVVPSTAASYFYETFPCQAANTNGYDTLQFAVKGAAGGSVAIEIQTSAKCSDTAYTSKFYLVTGITGSTQPITVQLKTAFPGANLNAIKSFVFFQFSNVTTPWEMSQVQFGCGSSGFIGAPVSSRSFKKSQWCSNLTLHRCSWTASSTSKTRSCEPSTSW